MNRKNQFVVFRLGKDNATAYDSTNLRYFVPKDLRATIKKGDTVLAIEEHFDKSAVRDENGNPVLDANGKPTFENKEFDRWTITFAGTREEVAIAQGEAEIMAAVSSAIVQNEIAKSLAKIAKERVNVAELEEASA